MMLENAQAYLNLPHPILAGAYLQSCQFLNTAITGSSSFRRRGLDLEDGINQDSQSKGS